MAQPPATIRILHVDDEPDFAELAATFLEQEDDRFEVETTTSASEALDALAAGEYDCVVSDYDMPETDGIEFLVAVRNEHPTLPFILFTGMGSEEIASDALAAGVTDYLQKSTGTDQYAVLANRLVNAVERWRAQRAVEETKSQLEAITEHSTDAIVTIDADSRIRFANPAVEDLFGYDPGELRGTSLTRLMPGRLQDDHQAAVERHLQTGERTVDWTGVEFPARHRSGAEFRISISFGSFEQSGERRFVGVIRDVSGTD